MRNKDEQHREKSTSKITTTPITTERKCLIHSTPSKSIFQCLVASAAMLLFISKFDFHFAAQDKNQARALHLVVRADVCLCVCVIQIRSLARANDELKRDVSLSLFNTSLMVLLRYSKFAKRSKCTEHSLEETKSG